jgi:hypothetical protein
MQNIKKVAQEIKEQNGNDKLSNKDLLLYIIKRLDDLENEYGKTRAKVSKLEGIIGIFGVILTGILLKITIL